MFQKSRNVQKQNDSGNHKKQLYFHSTRNDVSLAVQFEVDCFVETPNGFVCSSRISDFSNGTMFPLAFILVLTFSAFFFFFAGCVVFRYLTTNKHVLQREPGEPLEHGNHLTFLRLVTLVETNLHSMLAYIDCRFVNKWLIERKFSHIEINYNQFVDSLKVCNPGLDSQQQVNTEIQQLTNIVLQLYIESWHDKVKLNKLDVKDFKYFARQIIETSLKNFHQVCLRKLNNPNFYMEVVQEIQTNLEKRKNGYEFKNFGSKSEIKFLTNLIDTIFGQVLSDDTYDALACHHAGCSLGCHGDELCLQSCKNPVRLFIYNLIVFSLLIPMFNKITSPKYILYNFILLFEQMGGVSMKDFIDQFQNEPGYIRKFFELDEVSMDSSASIHNFAIEGEFDS